MAGVGSDDATGGSKAPGWSEVIRLQGQVPTIGQSIDAFRAAIERAQDQYPDLRGFTWEGVVDTLVERATLKVEAASVMKQIEKAAEQHQLRDPGMSGYANAVFELSRKLTEIKADAIPGSSAVFQAIRVAADRHGLPDDESLEWCVSQLDQRLGHQVGMLTEMEERLRRMSREEVEHQALLKLIREAGLQHEIRGLTPTSTVASLRDRLTEKTIAHANLEADLKQAEQQQQRSSARNTTLRHERYTLREENTALKAQIERMQADSNARSPRPSLDDDWDDEMDGKPARKAPKQHEITIYGLPDLHEVAGGLHAIAEALEGLEGFKISENDDETPVFQDRSL